MQTLLQDLRFAIRILAKGPGFTAVAMISLALGIGVNTTIFSLINGLLFRPLPRVKEPATLVWFRAPASYPDYEDFRDQNDVFSGISALSGTSEFSLSQGGQPELVKGEFVSANYFSVLGVDLSTGRAFLPDEDRLADAQPVVVLNYGLWQRRFGGDPNLIGGSVSLNGLTFTVIGVAPQGFVGAEAALLHAVVSLVLFTACANIAGLLLARSSLRRREIGIRQALGASRARIVQQLLTEGLLLSLLGALAGLLLAMWAKGLLISLVSATPIAALDLSLDYRVLAFTFSASLLAGLAFGLAPALQASKPDLIPALKNETAGKGYRRSRLRNV